VKTVRLLGLAIACVMVATPAAAAEKSTPGAGGFPEASTPGTGGFFEVPLVQVSISRARVDTRLGESFSFSSKITNTGPAQRSGLIAHLNVVGLSSGIYVDPEDWSEERTKNVPTLRSGESTDISWNVKAVTGGRVAIYVVALSIDNPSAAAVGPAASPAMYVRIADTKDLNSGGVLPLALGVPALLGAATLTVRRRRR
jgi:hypothetical protein